MKALFPGDNIYKAFPNVYTIRELLYRSFRSWYKSIEKMMSFEPEILVPSHGKPILAKKRYKIFWEHTEMQLNMCMTKQ